MTYVFLTIGVVISAIFISQRTTDVSLRIVVLKAISSMFFVLTAASAFLENDECNKLIGVLVIIGAFWGLLGDVSLDLKYVFPKKSNAFLYSGFISFLIGHLFYIGAFLKTFGFSKKAIIIGIVFFVATGVGVIITEPIFKVKYNEFKPITVLYIAVLGFSLGFNLGFAIDLGFKPLNIILCIGLALFLLSDVLLSGLYFGLSDKDRNNRPAIIFNHIFYYIAQYLIAVSLLLI